MEREKNLGHTLNSLIKSESWHSFFVPFGFSLFIPHFKPWETGSLIVGGSGSTCQPRLNLNPYCLPLKAQLFCADKVHLAGLGTSLKSCYLGHWLYMDSLTSSPVAGPVSRPPTPHARNIRLDDRSFCRQSSPPRRHTHPSRRRRGRGRGYGHVSRPHVTRFDERQDRPRRRDEREDSIGPSRIPPVSNRSEPYSRAAENDRRNITHNHVHFKRDGNTRRLHIDTRKKNFDKMDIDVKPRTFRDVDEDSSSSPTEETANGPSRSSSGSGNSTGQQLAHEPLSSSSDSGNSIAYQKNNAQKLVEVITKIMPNFAVPATPGVPPGKHSLSLKLIRGWSSS